MARHETEERGPQGISTEWVLTNHLYGRRDGWAARWRILPDGLRVLRPDLGTFRETILMGGYDQAADLLGAGYHRAHSRAREDDGQGIAITSR